MVRIGLMLMVWALGSLAQTPSRAETQRRFPPEVWAAKADSASLRKKPSYCVERNFQSRSLAFRKCEQKKPLRLLPTTVVLPKTPAK